MLFHPVKEKMFEKWICGYVFKFGILHVYQLIYTKHCYSLHAQIHFFLFFSFKKLTVTYLYSSKYLGPSQSPFFLNHFLIQSVLLLHSYQNHFGTNIASLFLYFPSHFCHSFSCGRALSPHFSNVFPIFCITTLILGYC